DAPEILEELAARMPPGWRKVPNGPVDLLYSIRLGRAATRPGVRPFHLLYGGVARIARSHELLDILETLESDAQLSVAEFARQRLFVHAGVVGWKGRAILLPGRSLAGKSTL